MALPSTFQSIVAGHNGTPEAQHAIEAALALAQCCRARLLLLAVLTPLSAEQQAEGIGIEKTEQEHAALKASLKQAVDEGRAKGIEVTCEVVEGRAENEIERYVKEHGVDLLVVGHRDISRPRRWLEGSTSEDLAKHLRVSILIVHEPGS